jgi:hypothetical protein
MSGEEHETNMRHALGQRALQVQSVDIRHSQIRNHASDLLVFHDCKKLSGGRKLQDSQSSLGKSSYHSPTNRIIVVDKGYGFLFRRRGIFQVASLNTGREISKVEPRSGLRRAES